jgi:putative SOS response-associated peptidase YedK
MCARYTLFTPAGILAERFRLAQVPDLVARYNVSPSQTVPVIGSKADGQGRGLAMFRWGFIPHWAHEPGMRPVNAKAETVADRPMFSESFRQRRCLIPASGFYEWRTVAKKKFPVHFRLKGGAPFAFAGIWDVWSGEQGKVFSCCLLTTTPNELTKTVHDRMPVILRPEDEETWLDPKVDDVGRLHPLLKPYRAEDMEALPANPAMNKPSFEGPDALTPPTSLSA